MPEENLLKESAAHLNSSDDNIKNSHTAIMQRYNVSSLKPKTAIPVDVTMLDKIKRKCEEIKSAKFPIEELLLGIASLLAGAFLNALFASVKLEATMLGVFSYIICPTGTAGCGVAYAMLKKTGTHNAHQVAKEILECIQDIENQCDTAEGTHTNSAQAVNSEIKSGV